MATHTYFCDLAQNFSDNTGDQDGDGTGNVYEGPGGFDAAIHGQGNATALAAGDTLYLKGTADLQLLLVLDLDTDVGGGGLAWAVDDVIYNDNDGGGTEGDHWQGKVVRTDVDSDGTLVLIQLDSGYTKANVTDNVADGVWNNTQSEAADFATPAAGDVDCRGIEIDQASGSTANGTINIVGCDSSWNARAAQAVLDANSAAASAITIDSVSAYTLEYLTAQEATSHGIKYSGNANEIVLRHCLSQNNTGGGFALYNSTFIRCIAYNNGGDGFAGAYRWNGMALCRSYGNTGAGLRLQSYNRAVYGSVFHENTDDNIHLDDGDVLIINTVCDDSQAGSGIRLDGGNATLVLACRLTNNADHGVEDDTAAEHTNVEDWNVFYGNTNGDLQNILSGRHSYGDGANHVSDPASDGFDNSGNDDYDVTAGKEIDGTTAQGGEIDLFWDA